MPGKKHVCENGQEFVFKLPDGTVIGKARDIDEFKGLIKQLPLDSILYHAKEGHFAPWLEFIGEKAKAKKVASLKPARTSVRIQLLRAIR